MGNGVVEPGEVVAGKYRVQRVLGVGGMGVVVQATTLGPRREVVALKLMLPEVMAVPEVHERFLREGRLAATLQSEHVTRVVDVGTTERGVPYIAMEYLEGTDLSRLLEEKGPLSFADAAEYVVQACEALAEAHALGIVHRDLKPANLFLTRRPDGSPLVKLLDFGISKVNQLGEGGLGITRASTMMGSPYYTSPEQMRSARDVDTRSDVWSLGVILFQLLTARLPFDGDTLGSLMAAVHQDDPSKISAHRRDVPPAFEAIVRRCLQRDRDARVQSVTEIAHALAPFATAAASRPLVTTPPVTRSIIPSVRPTESIPPAPITLRAGPRPRSALRSKEGAGVILCAIALGIALGAAAFYATKHTHPAAVVASPVEPAPAEIAANDAGRDGAPGRGSPNPSGQDGGHPHAF